MHEFAYRIMKNGYYTWNPYDELSFIEILKEVFRIFINFDIMRIKIYGFCLMVVNKMDTKVIYLSYF